MPQSDHKTFHQNLKKVYKNPTIIHNTNEICYNKNRGVSMEKKKIWWIIGLLTLMWVSVAGQYMQYIDTLGYGKCCLAGLIGVVVIVAIMMIIPFICRLVNKG